jgi:succinate dehydrogenase / fumarate reductase membrane anchor subunit
MAYLTDSKRVEGLGSAKSGTHHFWTMTVTSVALLVLTPFSSRSSARCWAPPTKRSWPHCRARWPAVVVAAYLVVGMHHFRLGVTT